MPKKTKRVLRKKPKGARSNSLNRIKTRTPTVKKSVLQEFYRLFQQYEPKPVKRKSTIPRKSIPKRKSTTPRKTKENTLYETIKSKTLYSNTLHRNVNVRRRDYDFKRNYIGKDVSHLKMNLNFRQSVQSAAHKYLKGKFSGKGEKYVGLRFKVKLEGEQSRWVGVVRACIKSKKDLDKYIDLAISELCATGETYLKKITGSSISIEGFAAEIVR